MVRHESFLALVLGIVMVLVLLVGACAKQPAKEAPKPQAPAPAAKEAPKQAPQQPPAGGAQDYTKLAGKLECSLCAAGEAEAFPLIAKYHWSKLPYTPGQKPKRGGVFKLEGRFDLNTWDPTSPEISSLAIQTNLPYSRLMSPDFTLETAWKTKGKSLREIIQVGDLAESWSQPDNLTFVFKLRPGIKWHNFPPANGREFKASDVKFAYETYMKDPRSTGQKSIFRHVKSIEADDAARTVTFRMTQPAAYFLYSLAGPLVPVFNKEAYEQKGRLNQDPPIGTGPFIVKEHTFRSRIIYQRNPEYWKKDDFGQLLPYLDGVDSVWVTDRSAAVAAFRSGQIDSIMTLSGDERKQVETTETGKGFLRIMEQNSGGQHYFGLPLDTPPYTNVNFRRALSMALDRDSMNVAAWGDMGRWALGYPTDWLGLDFPIPAHKYGPYYEYNPAEARRLLKQEGLEGVTLDIHTSTNRFDSGQLELGMEYWKAIGLKVKLTVDEDVAFNSKAFTKDFNYMLGQSWYTGGVDLDDFTYRMMRTGEPGNFFRLSDPELDKLLDSQQAEFDRAKRIAIANKILQRDLDQVYRIFTTQFLFAEWTKPEVRNWVSHDIYFWINGWGLNALERVWLDK